MELGEDEVAAYAGNDAPASSVDMLCTAAYRCAAAAMRLGVFCALRHGPLQAPRLASELHADERGVTVLADALVSFGYLSRSAAGYTNTPLSERWLVDPPHATAELFWQQVLFELWDDLEESVRTGKPAVDFHAWLAERPETSRRYRSMVDDEAAVLADELAPLLPVPAGPARLLDVGGGHGRYAGALCALHPGLTATVLDLPDALGPGAERVTMVAGDHLRDDLGSGYDVVLLSDVLHGHPADVCRALLSRVAAAVRPGGLVAVLTHGTEAPGPAAVAFLRMLSLNLFHGQGGQVHPVAEIERWLTEAGFHSPGTRQLPKSPTRRLVTAAR